MKLLVLGGTSYLASHFIAYMEQKFSAKAGVFFASRHRDEKVSEKHIKIDDVIRFVEWSDTIAALKPDYIINFIGATYSRNLDEFIAVNFEFPRRLVEFCQVRAPQLRKLVLIGSASEFGDTGRQAASESSIMNPVNYYGLSKSLQTSYFRYVSAIKFLPVNIARIFNVVAPNPPPKSAFSAFIQKIHAANDGDVIETENLNLNRDFIALEDVCSALERIIFGDRVGEDYNICSGKQLKLFDMVQQLIQLSGKRIELTQRVDSNTPTIQTSLGSPQKLRDHFDWSPGSDVSAVIAKAFHSADNFAPRKN
jgi:nucleoside-diphosphate-sugar epimerase